jgi:acyl dehydratase
VPAFDYPLNIGLVELEEGIRLVTNIVACTPDQLELGMPLEVCFIDSHDDITLHQFRPARPARRVDSLTFNEVNVGDKLPLCPIPITATLIVAAAIGSRDYQDVHHDRDQARKKGSKDIFMNILTSSGLSGRYVSDWAGPDAILKNLKIRLGAPNYPYDTMTMSGSVTKKELVGNEGIVQIAFEGINSLGAHVTGTVDLALATGA